MKYRLSPQLPHRWQLHISVVHTCRSMTIGTDSSALPQGAEADEGPALGTTDLPGVSRRCGLGLPQRVAWKLQGYVNH